MAGVDATAADDRTSSAGASAPVSRSLERRPVARRGARAALPRRRVRADRREGLDRVHDPGSHRAVEAVAARVLRVLRQQGRARARAVRRDASARRTTTSARPSTPNRIRSSGSAPSRSASTSGAIPARRRASTARTTADAIIGVLDAARGQPLRAGARGALAPISHLLRELLEAAADAGAIRVADTRRAAALVQQTVMCSWFGNRLVENPKQRLTAEETWEFCLHGLGALTVASDLTRHRRRSTSCEPSW